MDYIMALDAGTTSSRTVIYDDKANVVATSQKEFRQIYPQPSWVEHDPEEIWDTQLYTIRDAISKAGIDPRDIKALGITNQRETTLVWDKATGKSICNAIVWQCRRTADICDELERDEEFASYVQQHTGLIIDAYFSGTKIKWILDNVSGARRKAESGELCFGTVDTWLIYNLTGGRAHVTDYTNASRTMLFDIDKLNWDDRLLERMGIPSSMLPKVVPSSGVCAYTDEALFGASVPIAGIAGDQQASLFGQGCFSPGEAKNTYGTGCFLLMNTGSRHVMSHSGLVTTLAASTGDQVSYALEGSVFIGGALVQWLRDELGLLKTSRESYECAIRAGDSQGVYVVPAFTGLGAPYWDRRARGMICNLTRGTGRDHIVRASLEAIAYQVADLVKAIESDSDIRLRELMVDGGACENDFLMQFQSDILSCDVNRPMNPESTALGACFLAGLGAGIFTSMDELKRVRQTEKIFSPLMDEAKKNELLSGWEKAVAMCRYGAGE